MHGMEVMQSGLCNLELGSNEFSGQKSARYQNVALDAGDSSILESEAGESQIQGFNLKKQTNNKEEPLVFSSICKTDSRNKGAQRCHCCKKKHFYCSVNTRA